MKGYDTMTKQHVSGNTNLSVIDSEYSNQKYDYSPLFASGLVAKIGAYGFTTLMAIASYMDNQGHSSPSQVELAKATGLHKNTVNRYINELLELEIDGRHLLLREMVNKGQGNIVTVYKVDFTVLRGNKPVKTKRTTRKKEFNASDAMKLFEDTYREVYHVNYASNYAREVNLLKNMVVTPYPQYAKEIIELAVRKYDEMFKNPRYPRPTVSMFSWAVNRLIPIIEEERKLTEIALKSNELEAQAEKRLAEKLAKLSGGAY